MRIAVTGATGRPVRRLVDRLRGRPDHDPPARETSRLTAREYFLR